MDNNAQFRISPRVVEALRPIISDMTRVMAFQQAHAGDTNSKVPDWVSAAKRCCCHVVFDGRQQAKLAIAKRSDGKLWCTACGREISTDFSKESSEKLLAALAEVNKVLLFGMINGLDDRAAQSIVSVKAVMPDIIQMNAELNQKLDNNQKAAKVTGAIGDEYRGEFAAMYNTGDAFTTMHG